MSFDGWKFKELGEEASSCDADLDSVKALTAKLKLQTRRPSYLEWKEQVQRQPWRAPEGSPPFKAVARGRGEEATSPSRSGPRKAPGPEAGGARQPPRGPRRAPVHELVEGEPEGEGVTPPRPRRAPTQAEDVPLTNTRGFATLGQALEWLRQELKEMQELDHQLARQLMRLRGQIHQLKVEQACHQHKEMLDDATFGLEDCEEDSDLLCNIPPKAAFSLSMPLKHIGLTRMNINSRRFSLC
ncbi:protein FAM167B-like [Lissotriton helveticus]